MTTTIKKIMVFSLLMLTLTANTVFASSNFKERTSKNSIATTNYSTVNTVYPNQNYYYPCSGYGCQNYGYYYQPNPNNDFIRNMYIISKMAEENPDVKFNYTSTNTVYL